MPTSQDELVRRAGWAASEVVRRLGGAPAESVILHRSQHITVHLPAIATVARISIDTAANTARLTRELAVARHLASRNAPIVAPSELYPPGPHVQDGFVMTLWPYVPHDVADDDNAEHVTSAAKALHQVHGALADYPGELPSYRDKIDECGALLAEASNLPALPDADRRFLLDMHGSLSRALASRHVDAVPIHGDAHLGNVLLTSRGARWTDLETVSLGPREWDVPGMPIAEFEPIDRELYAILADMRSVCVSVWCWALAHVPEKREAAEVHLSYLKEKYGRWRITSAQCRAHGNEMAGTRPAMTKEADREG
jgi:hypothetical protein